MGFTLSSLWLMMTYIYAKKILSERGSIPVFDWGLISVVGTFLLICIVAFIYGVNWVRQTKAEESERQSRYRSVAKMRKEA